MRVLLAIGGGLVLAMVALSAYGAVVLPPDARVPVHWRGSYGNHVSKRAGLIIWPLFGAIFEGLLFVIYLGASVRATSQGAVMVIIGMCVLLGFQAGAILVTTRRYSRRPPA